MEFKQIKNNKVYEQIIEQIRELIYEGELKKGDKLPSERQLKKDLGVSRASIREAFSALEMIGLIESRPGEGTFIRDSFDEDIFNPLSLILLLNDNVAEELLELRRVLEIDCVKLAAERATEAEIEELHSYIENLLSSSGYEEESIKADKMFHYTIARASGNKVLLFFMRSISEAMDFHIKNTRTKLVSKEETMTDFARQHQQIFKALKEHDPELAAAEMKNHLDYVEKLINKEIEG
jgi:GntR family transcriptional repressor for pyruvate dehydrogenase complex